MSLVVALERQVILQAFKGPMPETAFHFYAAQTFIKCWPAQIPGFTVKADEKGGCKAADGRDMRPCWEIGPNIKQRQADKDREDPPGWP